MAKLSTAQRVALEFIVKMADAMRTVPAVRYHPTTIDPLIESGLITLCGYFVTPTDAGRAALKEVSE